MAALMAETDRCDIRAVGGFNEDGSLYGWWFDGAGRRFSVGMNVDFTGRTEKVGGWTLDELRWLAERLPEGSKVMLP